ncbi:MAG: hypothetical protein WBB42_07240 [Polyangiales bacterium]
MGRSLYRPRASDQIRDVAEADGRIETSYLELFDFVDEKQFVLIFPDGTLNDQDERFWNATAACCDPGQSVDDVGYLSGLIEEAEQTYNIDPKRVEFADMTTDWLFEHSR